MSNLKKSAPAMKGIYLRGKIYWLQLPMSRGNRPAAITLETADLTTAIERAKDIRENPTLTTSTKLSDEIEKFTAYKLRMREWSPRSVDSKQAVLLAFARATGPRIGDLTTAHLQAYHDKLLKTRSETTVNGYMSHEVPLATSVMLAPAKAGKVAR